MLALVIKLLTHLHRWHVILWENGPLEISRHMNYSCLITVHLIRWNSRERTTITTHAVKPTRVSELVNHNTILQLNLYQELLIILQTPSSHASTSDKVLHGLSATWYGCALMEVYTSMFR